jgi:hypothetical protein
LIVVAGKIGKIIHKNGENPEIAISLVFPFTVISARRQEAGVKNA